MTLKPAQEPVQGSFRGPGTPDNAKTPLKTNEKALKTAPDNPDGQGEGSAANALVEALSGLFEKSMGKAAAEAAAGEGGKANT